MTLKRFALAAVAATCCWQAAWAADVDTAAPANNNGIKWRAFTFSYGEGKPKELKGFRASYAWQYDTFVWDYVNMHFDISAADWDTDWSKHKDIQILGIAPVFRVPLSTISSENIHPYLEGSVGATIMSHDHIATRDLGANLAFQDILGAGATIGNKEQFDVSYRYLHYSNAHLALPNEGIDVKWVVTLGYRF